jgi:hypothetical protein
MRSRIERQTRTRAGIIVGLTLAILTRTATAEERPTTIRNLTASSGKAYVAVMGGLQKSSGQYIDRDYTFDYVPPFLQGQTQLLTAGDDKFIDEDQPCLTFEVDEPVTVYVVYSDKMRILPAWLKEYTDTRWKVTRKDSNASTLKGLFTLFAKDFPKGQVTLKGNLSKGMAQDPDFKRLKGSTFCMYSVIVTPQKW